MANTRTRTHDARLSIPKPRSYDRSLDPRHVRCFAEQHLWDRRPHPDRLRAITGFYKYWVCTRCGATRTFWRNWAGQILSRNYANYPEGYERVTKMTKAEANVWLALYDAEQDRKVGRQSVTGAA